MAESEPVSHKTAEVDDKLKSFLWDFGIDIRDLDPVPLSEERKKELNEWAERDPGKINAELRAVDRSLGWYKRFKQYGLILAAILEEHPETAAAGVCQILADNPDSEASGFFVRLTMLSFLGDLIRTKPDLSLPVLDVYFTDPDADIRRQSYMFLPAITRFDPEMAAVKFESALADKEANDYAMVAFTELEEARPDLCRKLKAGIKASRRLKQIRTTVRQEENLAEFKKLNHLDPGIKEFEFYKRISRKTA